MNICRLRQTDVENIKEDIASKKTSENDGSSKWIFLDMTGKITYFLFFYSYVDSD